MWLLRTLGLALLFGLAAGPGLAYDDDDREPRAVDGVLDLSRWDFAAGGPARLTGDWSFYWGELLDPDGVSKAPPASPATLRFPSSWNEARVGPRRLGGLGFATHSLRVLLPERRPPDLALRFGELHAACRLWANGVLVVERGVVGRSAAEEVPSMRPGIVRLPAAGRELRLVLQISNYSHFEGGPVHPIDVGAAAELEAGEAYAANLDFLIMGSSGLISLYYASLFVMRRKERAHLVFAVLTFLIAVRVAAVGWHLLDWVPILGEMGQMRLDYATLFLAPAVYFAFLRAVFPADFPRSIALASRVFCGVGLGSLVLPPHLFTLLREPAMGVALLVTTLSFVFVVRAGVRGREGAFIMATSVVIVNITVAIDILRRLRVVHGGRDLGPLGGLVLVVSHAVVLGQRFSRAFRESEELNRTLERRVADRTADLERLARTDVLTGLDNRGELMRRGEIEIARAERYGHEVALLLLDVDHFKAVNDTHGHAVGDDALRGLGRALLALVRDHDVASRYGGEEFVLVLPHLDAAGARAAAERLRERVAGAAIALPGGGTLALTASVGVAVAFPGERFEDALRRADRALYAAKAAGRNRVELA